MVIVEPDSNMSPTTMRSPADVLAGLFTIAVVLVPVAVAFVEYTGACVIPNWANKMQNDNEMKDFLKRFECFITKGLNFLNKSKPTVCKSKAVCQIGFAVELPRGGIG